jgi:hypothetical protein
MARRKAWPGSGGLDLPRATQQQRREHHHGVAPLRHPEDLAAELDFTASNSVTGRFEDCLKRVQRRLTHPAMKKDSTALVVIKDHLRACRTTDLML